MPWRTTKNPYEIWVSEILLQQTQVQHAWPFYRKFLKKFPSVSALASADLNDVLKAWEGAGYYGRARNLHKAAGIMMQKHGGKVPSDAHELMKLPGVGPYVQAAVLSLAYRKDYAAVDGNVERVLTRVYGYGKEVSKASSKRWLQRKAQGLVIKGESRAFNLAMMDLGATVCTPRRPRCKECPVRNQCKARKEGTQEAYPVKRKKGRVPHYDVVTGIIRKHGRILIVQRPFEKLLGGLWEFPGGKQEPGESLKETCKREILEETRVRVRVGKLRVVVRHAYSHFRMTMHVFDCKYLSGQTKVNREHIKARWVPIKELKKFAFPGANKRVLKSLKANEK
ncbi:A/G-specific adenine glycosylase [Candidatus Micrarchaeota archaeon]|nr:A/G-specific adenine glycosylase [Candidatus Micrarchaeota archaeon]